MKNFTIAIISIVLLWGLSGCLYPGNHYVSGYYSDGYPYTHTHRGAYYDYPMFYPFGFYSLGYHFSHNSVYYPDRYYAHVPSRHDDLRKHYQYLKHNRNTHRQRDKAVVRSGHQKSGSRHFNQAIREYKRRIRCAGDRC